MTTKRVYVTAFHRVLSILLCVFLFGCATTQQESSAKVQLDDHVEVPLPKVNELGYSLTATQLITAQWPKESQGTKTSEANQSQQLPVQLQIENDTLVLAGFSSWGTRLLSLTYQNGQVTSDVMAGLGGVLPEPEQVLFNLMLTLWPSSAWEAPLNEVKWQIKDDERYRIITNKQGTTIIRIEYADSNKLEGKITFNHLTQGYSITIDTLNYSVTPSTPNHTMQ